ncbi:MAG: hypothetical protein WKF65_08470 [Gaiellaceae bacterium]
MIDLELYVEVVDFFDALEHHERWMGAAEAAFAFFGDRLPERDERDYVLLGLLRLTGHPKGEDWEKHARRAELDRQIWTFHRVWVDRYGWEPTMRLGEARKESWEAARQSRR